MRRTLLLVALTLSVFFAALSTAHATQVGAGRNLGLGFALGSPSALVGKAFLSRSNAIDFGLGFHNLGRNCWRGGDNRRYCDRGFNHITLNADYLWQDEIVKGSGAKLDWHIGVGGRVSIYGGDLGDDGLDLAARMPVGLDLTFPKPDFLEVFLELAPALHFVPGLWLHLAEAQLGVRFYF